MEINRIKELKVNCYLFDVVWDETHAGGSIDYESQIIEIGCGLNDRVTFQVILHELEELAAIEMRIRYDRPDCETDYMFVYDHRQHDTKENMVAGWLMEFIK